MKQLPVRTGNDVYAFNGNVQVYRRSQLDTVFENIYYTGDTPLFGKDQLIGVYTGRFSGSGTYVLYEVMWKHRYRKIPKFPPVTNPTQEQLDSYTEVTETLYGWVRDVDIYTDYVVDTAGDPGEEPNPDPAKQEVTPIPEGTGASESKSLFASIFGPTINTDGTTKVNKNAWYALGGVAVLSLLGLWLVNRD
jgi:hypothetical protein